MDMTALNIHIALNPLSCRIEPADGVPIKLSTAITAYPIPILVPMRLLSGESRTKQVGGNETKAPEKKP
jgi:hypothetical protein